MNRLKLRLYTLIIFFSSELLSTVTVWPDQWTSELKFRSVPHIELLYEFRRLVMLHTSRMDHFYTFMVLFCYFGAWQPQSNFTFVILTRVSRMFFKNITFWLTQKRKSYSIGMTRVSVKIIFRWTLPLKSWWNESGNRNFFCNDIHSSVTEKNEGGASMHSWFYASLLIWLRCGHCNQNESHGRWIMWACKGRFKGEVCSLCDTSGT